jgi:site-specific recombinase XerD
MRINNWVLDPTKYLARQEAIRLLAGCRERTKHTKGRNQQVAVRDYFMIHLALATGLRVMEIAVLQCGNLFLEGTLPAVLVRRGKGKKKRMVFFNQRLQKHCREFLAWKHSIGESIEPEAPLLSSHTGRHLTTRALQKAFKRCAQAAGLPSRYSIHCLRHTYACFLLKASNWNLRLVQKQLGHARLSTTEVYADVMQPDIQKALKQLF